MAGELIPLALSLVENGFSCIPIEMPDKAPAWKLLPIKTDELGDPILNDKGRVQHIWGPYQKRPPTPEECHTFWANGAGIAMVAGFNHVELIDFDIPEKGDEGFVAPGVAPAWKPFLGLLKENGHEELAKRIGCQGTPSGGYGLVYRCPEVEIPGNMKLACRSDNRTLIETRGAGGYFGIAPTPGYKLYGLDIRNIPVVSAEERDVLLTASRLLDERTIDHAERSVRYDRSVAQVSGRPGDWYKANGPHLVDLLIQHGWKEVGRSGKRIALTRPGKGHGISGTVTADGECFWCFTTSTAFLNDHAYDKFSVYTVLEHRNDFHEAAREIRRSMMPQTDIQKQSQTQLKAEIVTVEERQKTRWVTADTLSPEDVKWVLEPYIPLNEITVLVGDPGVGKSTLAQAICTAITTGGMIAGRKVEEGKVIFMSAEQSVRQITIPRFAKMGAKMSSILLPDEDDDEGNIKPFVLDEAGIVVLREQVEIFKPRLIVVDTVTAYFEAVRNMNAANEVREWMRRIGAIARANDCAALLLAHPNKSQSLNALHKISGSIDFSGAARSVLYAGADPDDRSIRGADHVKSNVGPLGKLIGFTITDEGEFQWLNDCKLSAEQMLEQPQTREARGKRAACEEWLRGLFTNGYEVEATTLIEEAKMLGFSRNLLFELKPKLGLATDRRGFGKDGRTFWLSNGMAERAERWDQK